MLSPLGSAADLEHLTEALLRLPRREAVTRLPPPLPRPRRVCSPREALFAPSEELPLEQCLGRVLADPGVTCPPAVPIVVCGEIIDDVAIALMDYYGVNRCRVVSKEQL